MEHENSDFRLASCKEIISYPSLRKLMQSFMLSTLLICGCTSPEQGARMTNDRSETTAMNEEKEENADESEDEENTENRNSPSERADRLRSERSREREDERLLNRD